MILEEAKRVIRVEAEALSALADSINGEFERAVDMILASHAQFLPGFLSDPNFRFVMIGVLIVAVILLRPGGILGEEKRVSRHVGDTGGAAPPDT